MKRDSVGFKCELYSADNISLIISGTGIIHSAASTAFIISQKGTPEIEGIVNIGVCGALSNQIKQGTPIIFNKIVNVITGKAFYPDMLLNTGIIEGTLHSFPNIVLKNNCPEGIEYVDMEAAGFIEAALMYMPPHKVNCIKTVSDHMESPRLEPSHISSIIEQNIPVLKTLLDGLKSLQNTKPLFLTGSDLDFLNTMSDNLKFTSTMRFQLKDLFQQYLVRTGNSPSVILENYKDKEVKSKLQGKAILNELRGVLAGE
jgi:Purine-nucleoside phosphorylase